MRYLLLCCFNEERWSALPDSQRDGIMRDYSEWIQGLDRSGQHVATGKLQSSSTATTVRARGGKPAVIDGPFAETKEQLGGYHLLECGSLDEAIAIAKRIPTIPFGGAVEVRALESQETA
jgi:hypothetical protein